jgi:hypothetical protein
LAVKHTICRQPRNLNGIAELIEALYLLHLPSHFHCAYGNARTIAGPRTLVTPSGKDFHKEIANLNRGFAGEKFGIFFLLTRKN